VLLAKPDVEFLGETAVCDRPEARYGRRHLQVETRGIDDVELESNGYIPAHGPIVPTTRLARFAVAPAARRAVNYRVGSDVPRTVSLRDRPVGLGSSRMGARSGFL
jgi:hypothetical protein